MMTDIDLLIKMLSNQKDDFESVMDSFNESPDEGKDNYLPQIESCMKGVSSLENEINQLEESNEELNSLREDLSLLLVIANTQFQEYKQRRLKEQR